MSDASANDDCVGAALFTDLVGFTAYTDHVGDGAALQVLEAQTKMATAVIEARTVLQCCAGARIVKELGDGLMLWFDSPAEGLEVASEFLHAVEAARNRGEFPLAVRMGMHHGPALSRGDDVIGQTVNIAARVSELAGPGELLVSESVVEGGRDLSLVFEPIGPVRVKGVSEPVWLNRLSS